MFALRCGGTDGSATISDAFDVVGFALLALFNGQVARVLSDAGSMESISQRKQAWQPVFLCMIVGLLITMPTLFGAVQLEEEAKL